MPYWQTKRQPQLAENAAKTRCRVDMRPVDLVDLVDLVDAVDPRGCW